jgi:hypothetical protein
MKSRNFESRILGRELVVGCALARNVARKRASYWSTAYRLPPPA